MQSGNVTTPFGRRPMTLALVKGQLDTAGPRPDRAVEKWKVFRDVAEARQALGLQDRAVAVLNALLTFYPHNELKPDTSLVVFPSNAQLAVRAHGIAGTTLRRHLAVLIDAGLVHRRDSPNGKRYAHRDGEGQIEQAYGFDLEPLLSRAAELATLAQEVAEEARAFRRAKEALTICRRDVRKLISAAMEEGAEGDWAEIEDMYVSILAGIPRSPSRKQVEAALDEMGLLREEIINLLENQFKTKNTATSDDQIGRHIQNSKPELISAFEPRSEEKQEAKSEPTQRADQPGVTPQVKPRGADPIKVFPLNMVTRACPQIIDYGPGGQIGSWRDLMAAAVVVRSMLGVSPSAYQDACEIMGAENAAATMACILERSGHINSPGAYLRDLTSRAKRGEYSAGPALMALLRANGVEVKRA